MIAPRPWGTARALNGRAPVRLLLMLLSFLVGDVWLGCGTSIPEGYLDWTGRHYDGAAANTLDVGDRFSITVAFHDEMSAEFTVPNSGQVDYQFIGTVNVLERLCEDIAHEIRERLANGFLSDPTVQCEVLEIRSRQVVVSGEVQSPGVQPYAANLSIVEAIAGAGGLTREAAKDRVIVTRQDDTGLVEIVVPFQQVLSGRAATLPLWPGDSVFVPSFRLIP